MEHDLRSITARFSISFSKIEIAKNAMLSKVYTLDGSYVLRSRALSDATLAKFKNEQKLVEIIRPLVELELPRPLLAVDGKPYTIKENAMWTLYPIIAGDVYCTWYNLELLPQAAREQVYIALSELHDRTRGKLIDIERTNNFLTDIKRWISSLPEGTLDDTQLNRVRKALDVVSSTLVSENDLCFVHGDFHPGNIVFRAGKPVGLLDLDWSRKGNALEDASYTLMTMMRDYMQAYGFNDAEFEMGLSLYKLPEGMRPLFNEYLILACFYDLYIFLTLREVQFKSHILPYQIAFLNDLRQRF